MSGFAIIAVELVLLLLERYPELRAQYEKMRGYRDRNEEPPAQEFLDVLARINANSARIQSAADALGVRYQPPAPPSPSSGGLAPVTSTEARPEDVPVVSG